MRNRAMRTLLVLSLLGSVAGPACDCGGTVVDRQVRLSFVYPTDGGTVTSADDVNATASGIQVNVVVRVIGAQRGARVVLTNNLDLGPTGVPVPTDGVVTTGSDGQGQAVFAGYSLPDGQVTLTATLDSVAASARVTVAQSVCTFNSPRDGDVITSDPHPPAQPDPLDPVDIDVVADCVGLSAGDFVAVRANDGFPLVGAVDASGRVTIPGLPLGEGPNVLALSAHTNAAGEYADGATTLVTVTVSTGRCTAVLSPGDGSHLLAEDDADVAPGMQALLSFTTTCPSTSTVEVLIRQSPATSYTTLATFGPAQYNSATQRYDLGALELPESLAAFDVQLVAVVTDSATSRSGVSVPSHYWIDSIRPQLQLVSPTGELCVGPLQDTDAVTEGIQTAAFGTVQLAAAGAEVWATVESSTHPLVSCINNAGCDTGLLCRGEVCRSVGILDANGNFTIAPIDVPAGIVTISVIALDSAGNRTAAQTATLNVFDVVPTATITSLTDGQQLGISADTNAAVDDLQHELVVALTNVPANAIGTVTISGQSPRTFLPAGGAAVEARIPLTLLDGAHTIAVRVEDSCGNRTLSNSVNVVVDTTPSDIVITGYQAGGFPSRAAIEDGGSTWASALDLDVVVGTADTDRTLGVRVTDAFTVGAGGRTCSGTQTYLTTEPVTAAEVGNLFAGIPLATAVGASSTVNCVEVTLDDGINETSTTRLYYRRLATPTPTITAPVDNATLNVDGDVTAPGFNASVAVSLNAADTAVGELFLDIGTWNVVRKVVLAGTDSIVLTAAEVSLPLGTYNLTARYVDAFGNEEASAVVTITVDPGTSAPELVLTQPTAGAATTSNVFTVTHTGASTPVSCGLYVDSAGVPVATAAFSSGSLNLTASSLASGAHRAWITCVDGSAVTGSTQSVDFVYYGGVPAAPALLNEPTTAPGRLIFDVAGSYVNMYVPDTASATALQHDITAQPASFDGLDGWQLELTATPPGGSPVIYTRPVPLGGNGVTVFSSVAFGATDGDLELSLVAIDPLGGRSSATVVDFTVDRTPPTLTQTEPATTVTLLTGDDDTDNDATYVNVYFRYVATGAVLTADCALTPALCLQLSVMPTPATHQQSQFPQRLAATATSTRFGPYGLADGSYNVAASLQDPAGNTASTSYNVDVVNLTPQVDFAAGTLTSPLTRAKDVDLATAAFEGRFTFIGRGLVDGSTAVLCSTVPAPGAVSPVICKLGSDGALGGPDVGYVVGTTRLSGTIGATAGQIPAGLLAQGAQTLHVEAFESTTSTPVAGAFVPVVVDSQPPVVESLSLTQNVTGNDDVTGGVVRLNASEGTVQGSALVTAVSVQVSGLTSGRTVQIKSGAVVVGSGAVNGTGLATFNVTLPQGSHTLSAHCTDEVGNPNEPVTHAEPAISAVVDVTPGTVSVAAAAFALYDAAHGALNTHSTTTRSDDTLDVTINVTVSDNQALTGGTVTLSRYAAASGGSALATVSQTLAAGQTTVTFASFPLAQAIGANYLAATFSDVAGNAANSEGASNDNGRRAYAVDFYGPTLTLEARNAVGTTLTCTSSASCYADVLTPGGDGRGKLDVLAQDAYRNAGGMGLYFTLGECANGFGENCSTYNISVALQSRLAGSGAAFAPVLAGTLGATGDVTSPAVYLEDAASSPRTVLYALDPGGAREVRLVATDKNNNVSVSPSVFLQLDLDGVLIEVERRAVDGQALAPAEFLSDDTYWNASQNQGGPSAFTTALRVHITHIGTSTLAPSSVTVQVTADTGSFDRTLSVVGSGGLYTADFDGTDAAVFATSPDLQNFHPNSVDVTVDCDTTLGCGTRTYLNVVADLDGPTYEFWRCSLRDLQVPLVAVDDNTIYEVCDDADLGGDANIAASPAVALWNAAMDRDGNPANGFTISPTTLEPLRVNIRGLENSQPVGIVSSQAGGLSGQTEVLSTSCDGTGTDCNATFSDLGVASLSGTAEHAISVSFFDRAGNPAAPDPSRGSEIIHARVDVIAPAGTRPTVCIGESTTPQGVTPATDPTTYEDPVICPVACTATEACSRRHGDVTLSWVAPGDDNGTGNRVARYEVVVAAREVNYTGPVSYASCGALTSAGPFEQGPMVLTPTVDPGGEEMTTIVDLYPHRSYCFGVTAVDDLENRSPLTSFVAERKLPFIHYPEIAAFNPSAQDDAAGTPFLADATANSNFPYRAANVGDIDGDGRDDFAVARRGPTGTVPPGRVWLYTSTAPDVTIDEPSLAGWFGRDIAGGDFDGDGYSDLAICASRLTTTSADGGALYLYYGGPTGIRTVAQTADAALPSIAPDVVLLAPGGARFCDIVLFGNVDGQASDDLVVSASGLGDRDKVYGFLGGSRTRFPTVVGGTAKVSLDLDSAPGPFTNRPEFSLRGKLVGASAFPWKVVLADVDGDGAKDIAISDNTTSHDGDGNGTPSSSCGEVYVFRGGSTLVGAIAAPDTSPPNLMHVLRYYEAQNTNFGQTLLAVPSPAGASDSADWLLVQVGAGPRVVVFKGSGLSIPPGITPATYPLAAGTPYVELDRTDWHGVGELYFGYSMGVLGDVDLDGGIDVAMGIGIANDGASHATIIFSFDAAEGKFVKRSVLRGANAFSNVLVGIGDHFGTGSTGSPQFLIGVPGTRSLFVLH